MKKKRYVIPLSAALFLGMLLPAGADTAAPASSAVMADKARSCYSAFLNRKLIAASYNRYGYDMADINGDQVPELLFTQMIGGKSYLYTYNASANKVKKLKVAALGKSAPLMYYSTRKHQVCFVQADTGGYSYTVWQYKGKKLKKKYKIKYFNGKFRKRGYTYNGKSISLKKDRKDPEDYDFFPGTALYQSINRKVYENSRRISFVRTKTYQSVDMFLSHWKMYSAANSS